MKKFLTVLCLFSIIFTSLALTACGCKHQWEVQSVVKEPTCIQQGVGKYVCSLCEETKEDKIEVKEHDYSVLISDNVSCTSGGVAVYKCSTCDKTQEKEIQVTTHVFNDVGVCENCEAAKSGYNEFTFNGNIENLAKVYIWNNVTMRLAIYATEGYESVDLEFVASAMEDTAISWSVSVVNATTKILEVQFSGTTVAGSEGYEMIAETMEGVYNSTNKYYIKVDIANA